MGEPVLIRDIIKDVFAEIQRRYMARTSSASSTYGRLEGKDILAELKRQIRVRGIRRGRSDPPASGL